MAGDGSNERADGDGAGRDDRTSAMAADRLTPPGDAAGPVSISQPAPDGGLTDPELAQLEREAFEEVGAVALTHANRLPARSSKRELLFRIAALRLAPAQRDAPTDEAAAAA